MSHPGEYSAATYISISSVKLRSISRFKGILDVKCVVVCAWHLELCRLHVLPFYWSKLTESMYWTHLNHLGCHSGYEPLASTGIDNLYAILLKGVSCQAAEPVSIFLAARYITSGRVRCTQEAIIVADPDQQQCFAEADPTEADSTEADSTEAVLAQCVICCDAPAVSGFLHGSSMHVCVCKGCANEYSRPRGPRTCPMCRAPIEHIVLDVFTWRRFSRFLMFHNYHLRFVDEIDWRVV